MLDQAACNFAHTMYWHKNFQALARLDQLNQGEQDRIFNELIVANIVLIMLSFEAPDLGVDHGPYYATVAINETEFTGTTFIADTMEWSHGLYRDNTPVSQITRNVLNRLGR